MKGIAPGVNPNYLPVPAVVGSECRRQMNLRLDREARDRRMRPALPPPDIIRTPEEIAFAKALVAKAVASLKSVTADEDEARERHRASLWGRTNAMFQPDDDPRVMRERLGFGIGDEDGDREVA